MLGDVAVIGSGNMSGSSASGLVEAAVLTDNASTVAGVASFMEQLVRLSDELSEEKIKFLCRIKVKRRGWHGGGRNDKVKLGPLGNRTWLVGVRELVRKPTPDEQKMIDKAQKTLRPRLKNLDDEPDWLRWCGNTRFQRECSEGDLVIQIWRSSHVKRPSSVVQATPVLLRQTTKRWTRFYLPPATGREMSWGKFQHLLKTLGYPRRLGPYIEHLLEPDMADLIIRHWKT